jgi:predicted dehydrogenase
MFTAAVVGLGWWGRNLVNTSAQGDKIKVLSVTAGHPENHQDFADEAGVTLAKSYDEILENKDIDAVILATPHTQHEQQFLDAVAAGKQVFCEKPFSLTKDSAMRMVAAAEAKNLVIGVGHERRFESSMEEAQAFLSQGKHGTALHLEGNYSHNLLAELPLDSWRVSPAEGPSLPLTGMGIHFTDMYLWFFGPIESVNAQTAKRQAEWEAGDVITLQLKFASGATGLISSMATTPYYGRLSAFGTDGWIEVRDSGHPQAGGETYVTTCDKAGAQETHTLGPKNAVKANLDEWADAVEGKGDYRFTSQQLIDNVGVLEAIAKSIQSGQWEKV